MKKTIDSIAMRSHKTALNLIIVDFTDLQQLAEKHYLNHLKEWGVLEETLKSKEKLKLKLFHYYKIITEAILKNNNDRNIIFYVSSESPKLYLDILTKYFPFIVFYNNSDFNCLNESSGESKELLENIKSIRFNFDYSKFSPRRRDAFIQKYKIQI